MKECTEKHTKLQIDDDQWKCPACGIDNINGQFIVDDGPNLDCNLIHEEDQISCYNCSYEANGKKAVKDISKKLNMVCCPTCKGSGQIKGTARERLEIEVNMRDLGELRWRDFMKTNPAFALGDVFIFRSGGAGFDYDGYTVAVYEQPDPMAPSDICRKGIFWKKKYALDFANSLVGKP